MMKYFAIISVLVLLAVGVYFFFTQLTLQDGMTINLPAPQNSPQEVNNKASFLIFTNGTKRDFSDSRYHNLNKDVYIAPGNPTTVNAKSAVTWGDFFETLPMSLSSECLVTGTGQSFCSGNEGELKFFINGTENEDFLNIQINNGDKALITFGSLTETQIQNQLSQIPDPQ